MVDAFPEHVNYRTVCLVGDNQLDAMKSFGVQQYINGVVEHLAGISIVRRAPLVGRKANVAKAEQEIDQVACAVVIERGILLAHRGRERKKTYSRVGSARLVRHRSGTAVTCGYRSVGYEPASGLLFMYVLK